MTTNSPLSLRNSAWRRETVTSSRKMSLSGWRPALVDARSSRKREPALGPRLTTSRAEPAGSDSTPETGWSLAGGSASERKSARKTEVVSGERSGGTPGPSFVVTSGSPPDGGLVWCPGFTEMHCSSGKCDAVRAEHTRAGARSCKPTLQLWGREARSAARQLLVGGRVEQVVRNAGRVVGQPDLEHPARLVRAGVDQLGVGVEGIVDGRDGAGDGRVDVRDRLRGLDLAHSRTGRDLLADGGQLHEDDVAELGLGVVGDTDPDHPVPQVAHPLMGFGVTEVLG